MVISRRSGALKRDLRNILEDLEDFFNAARCISMFDIKHQISAGKFIVEEL